MSRVLESNLIQVKIVKGRCSTLLLFEKCCQMLLSAFGQMLNFPLDNAEPADVPLKKNQMLRLTVERVWPLLLKKAQQCSTLLDIC